MKEVPIADECCDIVISATGLRHNRTADPPLSSARDKLEISKQDFPQALFESSVLPTKSLVLLV